MELVLKVGELYTRRALQEALGLEPTKGAWFTGHVVHDNMHFIFCAIDTVGRTGHDYGNHFLGDDLIWFARTGSRVIHASIQDLVSPDATVYVFYREGDRDPFTYAGQAKAVEVEDSTPVKVRWSFADDPQSHPETLAEEIPESSVPIYEGAKKQVTVNVYERDPNARRKCIAHWQARCVVCHFDFEQVYGDLGRGFIHVHHLKPLGEVGEAYALDAIQDLRPVCPNCHAMLHRKKPALSIEELVVILDSARRS